MKYIKLILAAVFMLSIYSCDKPTSNTPTNPPIPANTQTFEVTGLNGITLKPIEEDYLTLSIQHKSGDQEQVSLSIKDLPANVSATFSAQTGTPTFASVCTLTSNGATDGNYTPALVVTTGTGSEKSYPFDLKVDNPASSDCRTEMVAEYAGSSGCAMGNNFTIILHPSDSKKVIITPKNTSLGSAPPGFAIMADVDCGNMTFNIPQQSTGGPNTIEGSGRILGEKKIEMWYTVPGGGACDHIYQGT